MIAPDAPTEEQVDSAAPAPAEPSQASVERVSIDSLHIDPANVRVHDERNKSTIRASLARFGAGRSIVLDKNNVVRAGNGTLEQARALGFDEVLVVEPKPNQLLAVKRSDWTDTVATAYSVQDNRSTDLSRNDDAALAAVLEAVRNEDTSLLEATGYTGDEVDELLRSLADNMLGNGTPAEDPGPQIDRADELQKKWQTATGQLWVIPSKTMRGGEHRLLCGDSTKAEDVARVMEGEKADLCFTSPPYGQQRDYEGCIGDWDELMRGVFGNLPMADAGQVLVNLGLIHRDGEWIPYWDGWIQWMREQGWRRFGWYVWDQGPGLAGDWNGRLAPSHEFVFHFNGSSRKVSKWVDKMPENIAKPHGKRLRDAKGIVQEVSSPAAYLQPTKIPDSVIRVMRHKARGVECEHPAVFSVELAAFVMRSWPGLAYEPFGGSGTTWIAAEQTGRLCRGVEISPKYISVALERLEGLGLRPVLSGEFAHDCATTTTQSQSML